MTRYDVSTFGEGQLRLTVPRGDRLLTARSLSMTAAGSEANVAGLLAQLGHQTMWGSLVPVGELGDRILNEYRAVGVDLSHVKRTKEGRVALYFLESGEAPMPGRVTYDREHTPFRDIEPAAFEWDAVLDTRVLFVTGITTALTEKTSAFIRYAVTEAHRRGIEVALDVNYRSLLWSPQDARNTLRRLLGYVDILFCSRQDGQRVFGVAGADGEQVAQALRESTGVKTVISTDRVNGVYYAGPEGNKNYEVAVVPVTDRPGAGDAFVAGTLDGHLNGDILAGIGHGLRTASYALTHHGDLTHIDRADLTAPASSDIVR